MKEKLMNIMLDPSIHVREIDPFTVSKYAQAMREGTVFPPLVLESKTNRIVCGNHRYTAYKRVFDPDFEVPVEFVKFKSEAEIIRMAARDNASHGRPLDTWDMKRVALRLKDLGDTPEEIARTLSVPVRKISEWAGMTVVVIGKNGKSRYVAPVKRGLEHMAGKEIKTDVYEAHKAHDPGNSVRSLAAVITRHINAGLIDVDDSKTMANLGDLYEALKKIIEKEKAA